MKKNEKDIRVLKEDKYTYEGKSSNGSELMKSSYTKSESPHPSE